MKVLARGGLKSRRAKGRDMYLHCHMRQNQFPSLVHVPVASELCVLIQMAKDAKQSIHAIMTINLADLQWLSYSYRKLLIFMQVCLWWKISENCWSNGIMLLLY